MKCSFSRLLISNALDSGRPLPNWVHRHISGCRACRSFFGESHSLSNKLRAESPVSGANFDPLLPGRVMAAVKRRETFQPRGKSVRTLMQRPAALAAAAAGLALIVIGGSLLLPGFGESSAPSRNEVAAVEEIASTVGAITKFGRDYLSKEKVAEEAATLSLYVAQPLTEEVVRMSADAEAVKGLLTALYPIVKASQGILERENGF